MRQKIFRPWLIASLALTLGGPSVSHAGNLGDATDTNDVPTASAMQVQEQNGIRFLSGGVGDEEQMALQHASRDYNLKLSMASGGKYMGNGTIRIEDSRGNQLVDAATSGPLFLAQLPAGQYRITAQAEGGQPITRQIHVKEHGRQQLVITWPNPGQRPIQAGDAPVDH